MVRLETAQEREWQNRSGFYAGPRVTFHLQCRGGGAAVAGRPDEWVARCILTETNVKAQSYRRHQVPTEWAERGSHDQAPFSNWKPFWQAEGSGGRARQKLRLCLLGLKIPPCPRLRLSPCLMSLLAAFHMLARAQGQTGRQD
ncbi:hypothetical protein SRHO_G00149700 [Serrasalmus rhombeus]